MFKKFAFAVALAAAASSSFAAGPTGYYASLDVGSTRIDNIPGNETGFGGAIGYGFNRFVALELGYRQLGKWAFGGGTATFGQTHFSVVGSYPLAPQFDIYGRLGHNHLTVDSSIRGFTHNDHPSGGVLGIGLHYDFSPVVAGRVEVQTPMSDIVNYSVGIVYKF